MRNTTTLLAITTSLALATWAAPAGAVQLSFPDGANELSPAEVGSLSLVWDSGCRVLSPSPFEQAALTAAGRRIVEALSDPRVEALWVTKSDWTLESGADHTTRPGEAALAAFRELATGLTRVSIFSFDGSAGAPCRLPLGRGYVNAFTPIGVPAIAFERAYLERLTHAEERELGLRRLARTLAHELAHALGHTHQDGASATGTSAYNNTVPVFLGCLAMSWPDVDFAAAHCGDSDWDRPVMPWSRTCDPMTRVAACSVDQAVELRVGEAWLPGKVVAVDQAHGRVRVDLGVSGSAHDWVDGCRIR